MQYQPVDTTEHPAEPQSSQELPKEPEALESKPVKPQQALEVLPPTYDEAETEQCPSYFDTSISGITDDGEVLVEGFPVGSATLFLLNCFVSMTFDFLGFLITTILATSHAAKYGSQGGLGLTMMRFGVYYKTKADQGIVARHSPEFDEEEILEKQKLTAWLLIVFGAFVSVVTRCNPESHCELRTGSAHEANHPVYIGRYDCLIKELTCIDIGRTVVFPQQPTDGDVKAPAVSQADLEQGDTCLKPLKRSKMCCKCLLTSWLSS